MKSYCPSKLATLLFLAVFFLTSLGTFSYAWCVGNDGHVEVNYATEDVCCGVNKIRESGIKYESPGLSRLSGQDCGLCLDFATPQNEAIFFKRIKRTTTVALEPLSPSSSFIKILPDNQLVARKVAFSKKLRIEQAILAHRTVVLLT